MCILSGCVSGKGRETATVPPASPQDVLGRIAAPDRGEVVRATARITITSSDGTYSRKMALLCQMPSHLRLEAIPLFGPADFFLSANEQSFKVFFPGEGKMYVGTPTRENLFLFFRIYIPPSDVIPLLCGIPPQMVNGSYSGFTEGGVYRIGHRREGDKERFLWIDLETRALMKIEQYRDSTLLWRMQFFGHAAVGEISLPRRIQIEVTEPEKVEIEIRYLELDIVPSSGDMALFDLRVPPGVTPIPLER